MSPMLTLIHVGAGTLSLLAGVAAMMLRKGSLWHRKAGNIFVVSMLLMSVLGAYGSTLEPFVVLDFLSGIFTFYLVATAWFAAMRREGGLMFIERVFPFIAGLICVSYYVFGLRAALGDEALLDGYPFGIFLTFGTLALVATIGDIRMIRRNGIFSDSHRIARHLWRMCTGMFFAVGSLFLGQQQVFPQALQGTLWLALPVCAVLLALVYWFVRIRFFTGVQRRIYFKRNTLRYLKGNDQVKIQTRSDNLSN